MRKVGVHDHLLSAEEARRALSYDSDTGDIVWKEPSSSRLKPGDSAGSVRADGYRKIRVNYHSYYAHRLAWLLYYGEWPEHDIDHVNHDPSDNRISNLRDVTNAENHKNLPKFSCNTSGIPGLSRSYNGVWRGRVYVNRKLHHSGSHVCLGRAVKSLSEVRAKLGFHQNHGQLAA